jgi:hypothetical protein
MFRPRIYVDTSVIGGCFDEEFKEYSVHLFDEFIKGMKMMVISDMLLFELEGAPDEVKNVLNSVPDDNTESKGTLRLTRCKRLRFAPSKSGFAELLLHRGSVSRNGSMQS